MATAPSAASTSNTAPPAAALTPNTNPHDIKNNRNAATAANAGGTKRTDETPEIKESDSSYCTARTAFKVMIAVGAILTILATLALVSQLLPVDPLTKLPQAGVFSKMFGAFREATISCAKALATDGQTFATFVTATSGGILLMGTVGLCHTNCTEARRMKALSQARDSASTLTGDAAKNTTTDAVKDTNKPKRSMTAPTPPVVVAQSTIDAVTRPFVEQIEMQNRLIQNLTTVMQNMLVYFYNTAQQSEAAMKMAGGMIGGIGNLFGAAAPASLHPDGQHDGDMEDGERNDGVRFAAQPSTVEITVDGSDPLNTTGTGRVDRRNTPFVRGTAGSGTSSSPLPHTHQSLLSHPSMIARPPLSSLLLPPSNRLSLSGRPLSMPPASSFLPPPSISGVINGGASRSAPNTTGAASIAGGSTEGSGASLSIGVLDSSSSGATLQPLTSPPQLPASTESGQSTSAAATLTAPPVGPTPTKPAVAQSVSSNSGSAPTNATVAASSTDTARTEVAPPKPPGVTPPAGDPNTKKVESPKAAKPAARPAEPPAATKPKGDDKKVESKDVKTPAQAAVKADSSDESDGGGNGSEDEDRVTVFTVTTESVNKQLIAEINNTAAEKALLTGSNALTQPEKDAVRKSLIRKQQLSQIKEKPIFESAQKKMMNALRAPIAAKVTAQFNAIAKAVKESGKKATEEDITDALKAVVQTTNVNEPTTKPVILNVTLADAARKKLLDEEDLIGNETGFYDRAKTAVESVLNKVNN